LPTAFDNVEVDLRHVTKRSALREGHTLRELASAIVNRKSFTSDFYALRDVSFTIEPGEKLAIVGATGSGKTTVTSLLLGFYAPQRGEIRIDGRPLADWDLRELRRHVGLALQDVFLFSGTIATNLGLGQPPPDASAIERAAREVRAHEFIERLPGGYQAKVVERGATVSVGERQLLAFARALAHDPRLVILDEATSSVDSHTESLIQGALRRLMQDRSALVIAHRLSTLQDVDRILVLHHGRVREQGTHDQLMAQGGIYARLRELQRLGATPRTAPAAPEDGSDLLTQTLDAPMNLA